MSTLVRLLREARRYWFQLGVTVMALLAITGLSLWTPLLIKEILRLLRVGGASAASLATVSRLCLLLFLAYTLRAAAQFCVRWFSHVAGHRVVQEVRNRLYDHLQKLSLRFFEDRQIGQLLARIVSDADKFESLISHALPDTLANALLFTGVAAVLFSQSPTLAVYTVLPMPLLALL
ncbi:MAG: ABC transporter transmembrane domain-containing protein, partial [Methanocella sp.]